VRNAPLPFWLTICVTRFAHQTRTVPHAVWIAISANFPPIVSVARRLRLRIRDLRKSVVLVISVRGCLPSGTDMSFPRPSYAYRGHAPGMAIESSRSSVRNCKSHPCLSLMLTGSHRYRSCKQPNYHRSSRLGQTVVCVVRETEFLNRSHQSKRHRSICVVDVGRVLFFRRRDFD